MHVVLRAEGGGAHRITFRGGDSGAALDLEEALGLGEAEGADGSERRDANPNR